VKQFLFGLVVSLIFATPAVAGDRDAADAADRGDAKPQFNLGHMNAVGEGISIKARVPLDTVMGNLYAKGLGVPQDYAEAVRRFRKAAERGDATAQYNLGVMYAEGTGVRQDFAEAETWYRRAAAQGLADALYNLGVLYANGQGVRQDNLDARKWYRKAADQGHAHAQYNLGVMDANGQGAAPNYVQSYLWLDRAAASFPAFETENRDKAINSRDLVDTKMTPAQIAEAQRLAREWKLRPEQ
jgi:hypothetical protein